MNSNFEITNIRWSAVVFIAAFTFIFGFTFFDKWMALLLAMFAIIAASFVTGRHKFGEVTKIVDIIPQQGVVVKEDMKK